MMVDPALPGASNAWTVLRQPDSPFVIHVSAVAQPDNWLAIRDIGAFKLVLTLLDTPDRRILGLIDLTMPKIVKTDARMRSVLLRHPRRPRRCRTAAHRHHTGAAAVYRQGCL